jgi:hypothetical protein
LWADCLYAMDRGWWMQYHAEVSKSFAGERCSLARMVSRFGVTHIERVKHYNNSGAAAMALAAARGAETIVMLGYDCQHTGGKAHWHGNHPKGLGNAGSVNKWAQGFAELATDLKKKGVTAINASRATALECFDRTDLETALAKITA